jgi:hypothetical protein
MAILGPNGTVYGDRADIRAAVLERRTPFSAIARKVFPGMAVNKSVGQFARVGRENFTRLPGGNATAKSGLGKPRTVDLLLGEITFRTAEEMLQSPLPDRQKNDLSDRFNLEVTMAEALMHSLLMQEESRAASLAFNTTTFPLDNASGFTAPVLWSSASAKPKDDAETALGLLAKRNGDVMDTTMVMSYANFLTLLNKENLVNDRRYVETTSLYLNEQNKAAVAAQLGMAKIEVGSAYFNTANENIAPVLSPVWSDEYVLVLNAGQESNDPNQYCLGRTFYNTGHFGLGTAKVIRDAGDTGDWVQYGIDLAAQINFSNLGVLIKVR